MIFAALKCIPWFGSKGFGVLKSWFRSMLGNTIGGAGVVVVVVVVVGSDMVVVGAGVVVVSAGSAYRTTTGGAVIVVSVVSVGSLVSSSPTGPELKKNEKYAEFGAHSFLPLFPGDYTHPITVGSTKNTPSFPRHMPFRHSTQ